jgi:ketosteroid isomerase-like protein
MELDERMDELFRLAAAGDADGVAAMCADGCVVRQNIGMDGGVDDLVGLIRSLAGAGVTTSYSDIRRVVGEHAVAEQHRVTLARSDGVEVVSDVCVVVRFDEGGRITSLDEYLDGAAFAPIFG